MTGMIRERVKIRRGGGVGGARKGLGRLRRYR